MITLLLRLMLIDALLQFGISLSDAEFCWSRQYAQQIEKHSRDVLKIDWKPIVVFPEDAKRFQ